MWREVDDTSAIPGGLFGPGQTMADMAAQAQRPEYELDEKAEPAMTSFRLMMVEARLKRIESKLDRALSGADTDTADGDD